MAEALSVTKTKLDGVLLIQAPTAFEDFRGTYVETYNQDLYRRAGITVPFVQDDISTSTRNVLRGIHGDAETWMDAVGPGGPWSPRGNRANDVQALWMGQIEASAWFARQMGEDTEADIWDRLRIDCRNNLIHMFLTGPENLVVDRLRADGTQEPRPRP